MLQGLWVSPLKDPFFFSKSLASTIIYLPVTCWLCFNFPAIILLRSWGYQRLITCHYIIFSTQCYWPYSCFTYIGGYSYALWLWGSWKIEGRLEKIYDLVHTQLVLFYLFSKAKFYEVQWCKLNKSARYIYMYIVFNFSSKWNGEQVLKRTYQLRRTMLPIHH